MSPTTSTSSQPAVPEFRVVLNSPPPSPGPDPDRDAAVAAGQHQHALQIIAQNMNGRQHRCEGCQSHAPFQVNVLCPNPKNEAVPDQTVAASPVPEEQDTHLGLFNGSTIHYVECCMPLYRAALEGDWKTAEKILQENPELAGERLGGKKDTVLNIAVAGRDIYFVEQLLKFMEDKGKLGALERVNEDGDTVLSIAAASGHVEIAKLIVQKNKGLLLTPRKDGKVPLSVATMYRRPEMIEYLTAATTATELASKKIFDPFINAIYLGSYDTALHLLDWHTDVSEFGLKALGLLASKRLKSSRSNQACWNQWISKCCDYLPGKSHSLIQDEALQLVERLWEEVLKVHHNDRTIFKDKKPSQLVFDATEVGNVGFIAILIKTLPDLIWKTNQLGRTMFHIAVEKRQAEVFNLIYEIGAVKEVVATYIDKEGNNILHLAAKRPDQELLDTTSGAALQMQRELMWYKEVEKIVPFHFRDMKNHNNETPQSLFTEQHEDLRKQGEKWMKTTANSYILVAALIATVAFAGAFTVPGGNDQEKGIPIFQRDPVFVVFVIADAISFFSSSTAAMMFVSILTSRYQQQDFLKSLPRKLVVGQSALFFSIAFMMVAFASTFFIMFKVGGLTPWISIPILVAATAAIPVGIFGFQQYSLLADICRSTYQTRFLFRQKRNKIFIKKENTPFLKRFALCV